MRHGTAFSPHVKRVLPLPTCSAGSILVPEVVTREGITDLRVRNVQVLATLRELLQAHPEGLGLDLCHLVSAHQWWQRQTLDLGRVAYELPLVF
jgi:hypothetical protein